MPTSPTPVVLVTGISVEAMEAAAIGWPWELANAVAVRHDLDTASGTLHRTVSDVTGVLEREVVDLDHACVTCAVREDLVPTLHRLAAMRRWAAIFSHLPVSAEARHVCQVAAEDSAATGVRVAAVVCAVDGSRLVDDLLGDDLVRERGIDTAGDDSRGVGEVCAGLIEYADVVSVVGDTGPAELDLVRVLARPDATVLSEGSPLGAEELIRRRHARTAAEGWVGEIRRGPLPPFDPTSDVWRLDLRATRPLHPDRLLANLERIGGGPRRSRGCFSLPSRPDSICAWDGAGGQLSVGVIGRWGKTRPLTRVVVIGMDDGATEIEAAFRHCVLTDAELAVHGPIWDVAHDGFEAWLGDTRRIA